MATITAIELDGDTCALARTTLRGREVTVSAAELLHPTTFPGTEAFVSALRNSRRALRLPRRCRVVLWGLPDGATPRDPGAAAALAPLTRAGFKVERVVTPCDALGALSRLKSVRGDDAACWVAINTSGVAIAAIRPGQQIYARSFGWDSSVGSTGSQARLLQRYSLVSFLTPEIKRAMGAASAIGYPVRAVVTCGNLPDLRSLTMPLIEELDVEVETLDSLDGLDVNPEDPERLNDLAAAIRIACAGVLARRTRPWDAAARAAAHRSAALTRAAAVVVLLAGLAGAYLLYGWWRTPPGASIPAASGTTAQPPAATSGRNLPRATDARSPRPETKPTPPPPRTAASDPSPVRTPQPKNHPSGAQPALLGDPLPRVTAIVVSNDRRYAAIDGRHVVGVGDTIGRRVVVSIDERAVTLREPSGARVRVGLAGRRR